MSLTKRCCVFICLLITCLGFLPYDVLASMRLPRQSPGLTLRLDPALQDVEPGHTFTVNVVVDGAVNLGAFQFDMVYDPTVVTVVNVELGPFLGRTGRTVQSAGPDIDNLVGVVTFGAFSLGSRAGPEGGGLLAILTFTAAGSGTGTLNLQNVLVTDTLANVQSTSVEGGTVTVSAPVPTSTPTMTPSQTMPPTATPTWTSTATSTETTEPVTTVVPTYAATATAPSETVMAPSPPPVNTETTTPVPTPVPTPTKPLTATPAETTTPAVTPVPTPTELLTSTPAETPQPDVAVTGVFSPTPGAVSPRTPAFTPRPLESPTATVGTVESPSVSPVPSSSPTGVWSNPLCWLSVGGTFLCIAGCAFYALFRQRGA